MTAAALSLWVRVQRRADLLTPRLRRALLAALHKAIEDVPPALLDGMLVTGAVEPLVDAVLQPPVFAPVRAELRRALVQEAALAVHFLPASARSGAVLAGFNILNPTIITAVRTMEVHVLATVRETVTGVVRSVVEKGLLRGVGPRQMARELRRDIALSERDRVAVENFRRLLLNNDPAALTRQLRDRRFDSTVQTAMAEGKPLPVSQVEQMVARYRQRMEAHNAETVTRTMATQAVKQGQRLSWDDAIERGAVDEGHLVHTWSGVMDMRERDEHKAREGETVPYSEPFSSGDLVPGASEFNCRCVEYVRWVRNVEDARAPGQGVEAAGARVIARALASIEAE